MPFQVGDRVRGKYSRELGTITAEVVSYEILWDGGARVENSEDWLEPAPSRPKFEIGDKVRQPDFSSETMEVWGINRTTESPGFLYTLRYPNHTLGYRWVAEEDLVVA